MVSLDTSDPRHRLRFLLHCRDLAPVAGSRGWVLCHRSDTAPVDVAILVVFFETKRSWVSVPHNAWIPGIYKIVEAILGSVF